MDDDLWGLTMLGVIADSWPITATFPLIHSVKIIIIIIRLI